MLLIKKSPAHTALTTAALVLLLACLSLPARAQSSDDEVEQGAAQVSSAQVARKLSSADPLERQRAAEELARLAAVDQLKLVEGYRLQEKNARVRLALDWALYRMGKPGALFNIVRDLDSSRRNQSDAYLGQLESPEPLYIFLGSMSGKTLARLIEVLARLGDAETLDHLKPYAESFDPQVADAARFARREISLRLKQTPEPTSTRPRQTGKTSDTEPDEHPQN
jgi:hypothetical protein